MMTNMKEKESQNKNNCHVLPLSFSLSSETETARSSTNTNTKTNFSTSTTGTGNGINTTSCPLKKKTKTTTFNALPSIRILRHRISSKINMILTTMLTSSMNNTKANLSSLKRQSSSRNTFLLSSIFLIFFILFLLRPYPTSSPHHDQVDIHIIVSDFNSLKDARNTIDSVQAINHKMTTRIIHFASTRNKHMANLNNIKEYIHVINANGMYKNPLTGILDYDERLKQENSILWVQAGSILLPNSLNWVTSVNKLYGSRPDIAAFVLDSIKPLTAIETNHWKEININNNNDAFIYRFCPYTINAFMINNGNNLMPLNKNLKVMETFIDWLKLRKNYWYKFPYGSGIENTPYDGSFYSPQINWSYAPWTVWFSKFVNEYQLGIMYPSLHDDGNQTIDLILDYKKDKNEYFNSSVMKMMMNNPTPSSVSQQQNQIIKREFYFNSNMLHLLGDGRQVQPSYFSKSTIDKLVDVARKQNGMISFTLVNKVFLNTTYSWLCNVDAGNFRPYGLVFGTTDKESYESLSKHTSKNIETVYLNEINENNDRGNEFGNPGYWKLMLERTILITEMLLNGISVFAFETDAIWLKDPFDYIDMSNDSNIDMIGTINTRFEVSGNFFLLKSTLSTRKLWSQISREFNSSYFSANLTSKLKDSWTYIENDQSLLTKFILEKKNSTNSNWKYLHPLHFQSLDMDKFVDGRWYDSEHTFYKSKRSKSPIVINNNFVIGVKEKTERAKKFGHWFYEEQNRECINDELIRNTIMYKSSREN